jgi:hypothetical protein
LLPEHVPHFWDESKAFLAGFSGKCGSFYGASCDSTVEYCDSESLVLPAGAPETPKWKIALRWASSYTKRSAISSIRTTMGF